MPTRRDGLAELSDADRQRFTRLAYRYEGIKMHAEMCQKRHQRFVLHADIASAPASAKVLHLVRHGEGVHNVWRAAEQAAGRKPMAKRSNRDQVPAELHDPLLSPKGEAEAAAAAEVAVWRKIPELIVVSPLRRATQTALAVFAHAIEDGVPVVAHELCREAWIGDDPSLYDSRLGRDALIRAFPKVEYQRFVFEEEDPPGGGLSERQGGSAAEVDDPFWHWAASPYGWSPRGHDEALVAEHAYAFLSFLMARKEKTIAVGSHSHFLLALLHGCCDAAFDGPQVFHTGELRTVAISVEPAPEVRGHYHTNAWEM